jgi:integrase/recombinase XerD
MELQKAIEDYIARKRMMGFAYRINAYELRALARFLPGASMRPIRTAEVEKFLASKQISRSTWIGRYTRLKAFFAHWRGRGEIDRIPLPRPRHERRPSFSPHVFTSVQIKALVKHASVLDHCLSAISSDTFRCMIVTMYATGLWLDESLCLRRDNFDDAEKILNLETRPSRTRRIPIGNDLNKLLKRHLRSSVPSEYVFSTKSGKRIDGHRAGICFRRCLKAAGIRSEDASRRQPGLRDLRHAFAVSRIVEWERRGLDMDLLMPRLSVYMGLRTLVTAERYLSLAPTHFRSQTRILRDRG